MRSGDRLTWVGISVGGWRHASPVGGDRPTSKPEWLTADLQPLSFLPNISFFLLSSAYSQVKQSLYVFGQLSKFRNPFSS